MTQINWRVSEKQKEKWEKAAKRQKMPMATWGKQILDSFAKLDGEDEPKPAKKKQYFNSTTMSEEIIETQTIPPLQGASSLIVPKGNELEVSATTPDEMQVTSTVSPPTARSDGSNKKRQQPR